MSGGPILYPNVTSLPGQVGAGQSAGIPKKQEGIAKEEFGKAFDQALNASADKPGNKPAGNDKPLSAVGGKAADLTQVKSPLKFSAHASQRLSERKIALDPATLQKVSDAVDRAEAKGVDDTLVLTKDAALIVSVKNRTVITAMDRGQMAGNVFTNIDGAVIV